MRTTRARVLVSVGVVLATIALAGSAAEAIIPPPNLLGLELIDGQCMFTLKSSQMVLGQALSFTNVTGGAHTVGDTAGFWSFTVGPGSTPSRQMNHAGTYTWLCDGNPDSAAPIAVKVAAPASISKKPFKLTWANSAAYAGYRYSVQFKVGSAGSIATWRSKVSARSAMFSPGRSNVTYFFRAMTWRTTTVSSGWSAWKSVHVT